MAKAVNVAGKVLKYGIACGLIGWAGYESLYNSMLRFPVFLFSLLCS